MISGTGQEWGVGSPMVWVFCERGQGEVVPEADQARARTPVPGRPGLLHLCEVPVSWSKRMVTLRGP